MRIVVKKKKNVYVLENCYKPNKLLDLMSNTYRCM